MIEKQLLRKKEQEEKKGKGQVLGKKKITIYIDESLFEEFQSYIRERHGPGEKRVLSYEVEHAIRSLLANHTHTNTKMDKVTQILSLVKDYLIKTHGYKNLDPGQIIPDIFLRKAIAQVRGADKRTIKKWLENFEEMKFIKRISLGAWEVLGE